MTKRRHTELLVTIAAFSAGAALFFGGEAVAQSVGLPEWTSEDAEKFEEPGSALLGGGLWPIELQPTPLPPLPEEAETMVKEAEGGEPLTAPEEMPRFEVPRIVITRRGEGLDEERATPEMEEAALGPAGEVPAEFRAAYFGDRPRAFLNDPQQLLSEQKTNDLSRFLEYHDGESKVTIYALIFGGRQQLPEGVTLQDLHAEWFGDNEGAVLAAYFLGEPDRAILEFGDTALTRLGAETVSAALEHCMEEARVAQNPFNQLERFCIELSIRLYWVERNSNNGQGIGGEAEMAANALPSENVTGAATSKRIDARSVALQGLGLLGVIAALGWIFWRHFRASSRRTFIFPDYEITPRLSAPHSGGAHAVMFFGKKDG